MAAAVGSYYPMVQSMTGAEYAAAISSGHHTTTRSLTLSSQWFVNPRQDQDNHYNNLFIQPFSPNSRITSSNHQEEEEEDEYEDVSIPTTEDLRRYDLIEEELAADNQYTTRGGLSKEAIAKRLNYVRNSSLHPPLDDTICVVCQDRLLFQKVDDDEKTIVGLDCGHDFHAGCIERWLLVKNRGLPEFAFDNHA